jgi:hypothetical protein
MATRYDKYDAVRSGAKQTYQMGLEWRPLNNLLVRGTYGTAFRAPDMHFVYAKASESISDFTDVLACGELLVEPVLPRGARIHPAVDGELVGGEFLRRGERRAPAIVRQRLHRRLAPRLLPLPPPQQHRRQQVMPVRIDVRLDDDVLPGGPLRGIPPLIHLRRHPFDDDAAQKCGVE